MKEGAYRKKYKRADEPISGISVKTPSDSGLSRRDFLRLGAAASLGLATGSIWRPSTLEAAPTQTSRVVMVIDEQANAGSTINPDVVRIMIDEGVKALTEAASPAEAWLTLFPDLATDYCTGIKINTINYYLSSHPQVALPLAGSLAATPTGISNYPENQIIIWDREDWELQTAGYTINSGTTGVRCFGTNTVGYNSMYLNCNGSYQQPSNILTDSCDGLINLAVLKNHNFAGVALGLKNHLGVIQWPSSLHANYCNPFVPSLNQQIRDELPVQENLFVIDAIFGDYSGGPSGPPNMNPKTIILSEDRVAADAIARDMLESAGCPTIGISGHVDTASQPPYSLGVSNLAEIEVITVENPSIGVKPGGSSTRPAKISLGPNYPEPFNTSTSFQITLDRFSEIELDIYNPRGRRIDSLYRGTLSPGNHTFSWDGWTASGRPAASGRYVIRLKEGRKIHSRMITLLR